MTKKQSITKSQITAALREAAFVPSKSGPLKIIVDVGNVDYYITRAQELLALANNSPSIEQCLKYLNTALSLIAISKVEIKNEETRLHDSVNSLDTNSSES